MLPYDNWNEFKERSKKVVSIVSDIISRFGVGVISLRYINFINILEDKIDVEDFFKSVPTLPDNLKACPRGFFSQISASLPDGVLSQVSMGMVEPEMEVGETIVLDITTMYDLSELNDNFEMWDKFDRLRSVKNQIFESLITDKTRKFFTKAEGKKNV